MTETALVVGATGLAGRHLVSSLAESSGQDVVGTFCSADSERRAAIACDLFKCDVTDQKQIIEVIQDVRPNVVYHFGANVSVADSHDKPRRVMETNTLGTVNLFAALSKLEKEVSVLVPGSAEEYGPVNPGELPITEEMATRPTNPYGISKVAQEQFSRYFGERFELDVYLPRTFHYTGPHQPPTFVSSDFASQVAAIERGEQTEIRVGNLDAKRDFLDIRDVVCAYRSIVDSGRPGEVYNVCSGESIKISDILDKLVEMSSTEVAVVVDEEKFRPLDVPDFRGDNSKLKQDTGWERAFEIEETLADVLSIHREA